MKDCAGRNRLIVERVRREGPEVNLSEIAREYNLSRARIQAIVGGAGISVRHLKRGRAARDVTCPKCGQAYAKGGYAEHVLAAGHRRFDPPGEKLERNAEAASLYDSGYNTSEIAEYFGVPQPVITRVLKRAGVAVVGRRRRKGGLVPAVEGAERVAAPPARDEPSTPAVARSEVSREDVIHHATEDTMKRGGPGDVTSAFEMLLEELEAEIAFVSSRGAIAFTERDLASANEALERARQATLFRGRVADLRDEWAGQQALVETKEDDATRAARRNLGRLRNGVRTPEGAYYRPILRALEERGGSAPIGEVLDRVGSLMKSVLNPVDHEPMPSDPSQQRWRNAAQWARHSLVQRGLLKDRSPRGLWELTEAGRRELRGEAANDGE